MPLSASLRIETICVSVNRLFFIVFGMDPETLLLYFQSVAQSGKLTASFEEPVKKLSGNWGYIDLFWPGRVLIEHKSAGQNLDKAHAQGMDYIRGLIDSGRQKEVPRWLIVSDFNRIALHDLEPDLDAAASKLTQSKPTIEFPLKDLHKHIRISLNHCMSPC